MQDSEIIERLSEAMLKNHESHWDLISRLQNKEPWTGEGLPPVGTVCEFRRTMPGAPWKSATILCVGEKRMFFRDKDGDELSRDHSEVEFRPIRTPEQIAAEERDRAIEEMREIITADDLKGFGITMQLGAIYDAGYRKV